MEMIPPPGLEVNIFVTNFKSMPDKRLSQIDVPYDPVESDSLQPPTRGYVRPTHSRSSSAESVDIQRYIDLNYHTGEYGDEVQFLPHDDTENYILDLTNFDGDNDARLPGEESFNRRVIKDGKLRRAKTREAAQAARQALEDGAGEDINRDNGRGRSEYMGHRRGRPSADSLLPQSRHNRHSRLSSEIDLRSTLDVSPERAHSQPPSRRASQNTVRSERRRPASYLEVEGLDVSRAPSPFREVDPNSDAYSMRGVVERDAISGEIRLEIGKQEMKDVSVVAEFARPGKPKLDQIIADEVLQAHGPVVVACKLPTPIAGFSFPNQFHSYVGCGPSSLNAIVRKNVALQIDPSRIRRGDMRGALTLISDEFQY
jgi:hypothetical protein